MFMKFCRCSTGHVCQRYWRYIRMKGNPSGGGQVLQETSVKRTRNGRHAERFLCSVVAVLFGVLLLSGCTHGDSKGTEAAHGKEQTTVENTKQKQEEKKEERQEKTLAVSYTVWQEVMEIDPNILTREMAANVLKEKIYHDFDEKMWDKDVAYGPIIWFDTSNRHQILHLGENYYYEFTVRGLKIPKDTVFLVHVSKRRCYVSRGYGKKPELYRQWVERIKSQEAKRRMDERENVQQALKKSEPKLEYTTFPYVNEDGYLCGVVKNVSKEKYSGGTIYFFLRDRNDNKVAQVSGRILELKPGERAEFRIPIMYELQQNPNITHFEFDEVGWL